MSTRSYRLAMAGGNGCLEIETSGSPSCVACAIRTTRDGHKSTCAVHATMLLQTPEWRQGMVDSVAPLATMGPSHAERIVFAQALTRRK